jgi:hypothetical protein
MMHVAMPHSTRRYKSPSFTCYHCKGEFRVRGVGKKTYCLECAHTVETQKHAAIMAVRYAIRMGRLKPPSDFACVDCGDPADRYDHRDYGKKLDVTPVCCSCNFSRGPAILDRR